MNVKGTLVNIDDSVIDAAKKEGYRKGWNDRKLHDSGIIEDAMKESRITSFKMEDSFFHIIDSGFIYNRHVPFFEVNTYEQTTMSGISPDFIGQLLKFLFYVSIVTDKRHTYLLFYLNILKTFPFLSIFCLSAVLRQKYGQKSRSRWRYCNSQK